MSAPRLTRAIIEGLIEHETFLRHGTLTLCVLDLKNGAQVVGQSNVISPENFSQELGEKFSREDAVNKIWMLEGYATKTRGAA